MQTLKMKKGKENPDLRLKQTTIQFPTQQVDNAAVSFISISSMPINA
jgi:hypothetical protein